MVVGREQFERKKADAGVFDEDDAEVGGGQCDSGPHARGLWTEAAAEIAGRV